MHTGVSDGNVVIARAYRPFSARNDSAGKRRSAAAASNIDGVRPSMTMRMVLVAGKGTQARVALGHAAAQASGERGNDGRFEITGPRNPRDSCEQDGRDADDQRRPRTRAHAPQRPGHDLRASKRTE